MTIGIERSGEDELAVFVNITGLDRRITGPISSTSSCFLDSQPGINRQEIFMRRMRNEINGPASQLSQRTDGSCQLEREVRVLARGNPR